MATTVSGVSFFVPFLLILLATFYESTHGIVEGGRGNYRTISAGGGGPIRRMVGIKRSNQIVDCTDMASKYRCSQHSSECRWCRSEALDDLCFSKSEAQRLPSQVFSCDY